MNRGRRGDVVFLDEKDYLEFINLPPRFLIDDGKEGM
jgi:uncharacterized C2H2 Zn-finger protein